MKKTGTIGSPGAYRNGLEDFDIGRDAGIVRKDEAEVGRQDPDHRGATAAKANSAPDDTGIGAKTTCPYAMSKDDVAWRVFQIVIETEEACRVSVADTEAAGRFEVTLATLICSAGPSPGSAPFVTQMPAIWSNCVDRWRRWNTSKEENGARLE